MLSNPTEPRPPEKPVVSQNHRHYRVWQRAREALAALPAYFKTETTIEGLRATDVFTLNSTLGATIEDQVVETLNHQMRAVWDPNGEYSLFSFVRQSQTFPDVLLARRRPDLYGIEEIAFGIELKGWYLLAKEGEPSFRYTVTPMACSEMDLIVVVPWILDNVVSGTPRVYQPFIESARYAALYRNWHWAHQRKTTKSPQISTPPDVRQYPKKSDQIADRPGYDPGGNFGRLARTGLMDSYMAAVMQEEIAGIPAKHWCQFFRVFQEGANSAKIDAALKRLEGQSTKAGRENKA